MLATILKSVIRFSFFTIRSLEFKSCVWNLLKQSNLICNNSLWKIFFFLISSHNRHPVYCCTGCPNLALLNRNAETMREFGFGHSFLETKFLYLFQVFRYRVFWNCCNFDPPRIFQLIEMVKQYSYKDFSIECSGVDSFCYIFTFFELWTKLRHFFPVSRRSTFYIFRFSRINWILVSFIIHKEFLR